jgi:hypothetical protein
MTFPRTAPVALAPLGRSQAAGAPPGSKAALAQVRGFDFLTGRWNVRHRKLRSRLDGCTDWFEFDGTLEVEPILGGLGNFDRNELADPSGAYEAHSLRLYNPTEDRWSIWWLDGRAPELGQPVVGRFEGHAGRFYADEKFGGRSIRVRTTYESFSAGLAQWTQAFSTDRGETWEVNWVMEFARRGE